MHKKLCKFGILLGTSLTLGLSVISFFSSKNLEASPGVFSCVADGTAVQAEASYVPTDAEFLSYKSENGHSYHDYVGNIYDVWDNYQGDGIRVAVIDSGIDTDHPDFFDEDGNSIIDYDTAVFITHVKSKTPAENKFIRSRDTNGNLSSGGYILRFYTDTEGNYFSIDGESIPIRDIITHWDGVQGTHGTKVSSTIASYPHETTHTGTIGIAPKVTLVPIKTDFFVDSIGEALGYVHELNTNDNPNDDIDVVNMSIEATSTWSTISTNAKKCTEDGTILFASAGNHNTNTKYYPASDPYIIGVGALEKFSLDTKASYSNYNSTFNTNWENNVDVTIVGNVYVAEDGGTYTETQGTSFASPICAGAAALWKQKYPNKTYNNFLTDLINACVDIGATGNDNVFGYGRLSIDKLLEAPSSILINNVNDHELELEVGETFQLEHSFVPSDYDGDFEYTTIHNDVISISDSGLITALAEGEDKVGVSAVGYDYVCDDISVTVVPSSIPQPETETYDITFGNSSGNGSVEITSSDGLKGTLSSGSDYVSSFNDLSKIYKDAERLKIGSSGNIGKFTVNLSTTISALDCVSITIYASKYKEDTGKIKLSADGVVLSSTLNPSNETLVYTFDVATKVSSIKVETTSNRAYINGISLECIKEGSTPSTNYTVSFDTKGGSNVASQTVASGTSITLPSASKTNYIFNGWATTDGGAAVYQSGAQYTVTGNATLYAVWGQGSTPPSSSYWTTWISQNSEAISSGGSDLLVALREKISNVAPGNSNTLSYDDLWSAYALTDSVPGSNGTLIMDMYGGFQFRFGTDQAGNYNKEGDVYNREHSVPKSWFDEAKPAYSDLVHLVPTDGQVNGRRSNNAFGEVNSVSYEYSFPARSYNGVEYQKAGISKLGSPKAINGVSTTQSVVFEPDDQYKGDFARIYMYFATRYGGTTCSATKDSGAAIFTSSYSASNPYMTNYGLALIRKWHEQDPVSEKERNRNNGIETKQGNRNPFVDYPEWADKIFGTHTAGDDPEPTVTEISLDKTSKTALVGDQFNLTPTITADQGADKTVTWTITNGSDVVSLNKTSTSDNESVTVTTLKSGSATITAKAGELTATCTVTVNEPVVKSFSLTKNSQALTSMTLDKYSDPSQSIVASITADTGADTSISWSYNPVGIVEVAGSGTNYTVAAQSVGSTTVTANCGGIEKSFTVSVSDSTPILVSSITISGANSIQTGTSTTLTANVSPENADNKGVTWSASPEEAVQLTANDSNNSVSVKAIGAVGTEVTITATAKDGSGVTGTHSIEITAVPPTMESFALNVEESRKVPFGQYRIANEMQLRVHYSDGSDVTVAEGATITSVGRSNLLLLGNVSIKIQYSGQTITETIFITNVGSEPYVGINSKSGTRAAGTFNVTPTEQAEAWAEYFIKETGGRNYSDGPCKLSSPEARETGLSNIWKNLETEYDNMVGLSKDEFCTNTTSSVIPEAREHYKYIVKTYKTLTQFAENSEGTSLAVKSNSIILDKVKDTSIIVAILITVCGAVIITLYFTFRKRKTY